ncbi:SMEK domain-containing protein [Clostridioides difficile]|nr:SMEK domain-containing protein [Clostridioides difficile]
MIIRQEQENKIFKYLGSLKNYICTSNQNGNFDINRYCENFFAELLNMIYDINLENLNNEKYNFPAVDLGDKNARICFQVTATNDFRKLQETIEKFKKHNLQIEFDNLYFLILGNRNKYRKEIFFNNIRYDYNKFVMDFDTLNSDIRNIKNIEKINSIVSFLESNLSLSGELKSFGEEVFKNNVMIVIKEEIRENLKKMLSIISVMGIIRFDIKQTLESIKCTEFRTRTYSFPFYYKMSLSRYNKIEAELIDNKCEFSSYIIKLYNQFALWNERGDLYNISRDEYPDFKKYILEELNRWDIENNQEE